MKQPLKRIDSEQEYWERHNEFNKEKQKLFRRGHKYIMNPLGFVQEYDHLLDEAEFIGLFPADFCFKERQRLYDVLNKPDDLKAWMKEHKKLFKDSLKGMIKRAKGDKIRN